MWVGGGGEGVRGNKQEIPCTTIPGKDVRSAGGFPAHRGAVFEEEGGACRFWINCCVGGGEVTVFVWEEAYNFDEFIHQPADLIPGTAWVANLGVTCCGLTDSPA